MRVADRIASSPIAVAYLDGRSVDGESPSMLPTRDEVMRLEAAMTDEMQHGFAPIHGLRSPAFVCVVPVGRRRPVARLWRCPRRLADCPRAPLLMPAHRWGAGDALADVLAGGVVTRDGAILDALTDDDE